MSEDLFQIDVSKFGYEKEEEDLVEIKLKNEDILKISFSKLVKQSKYIRDKYKYTDLLKFIHIEIKKIEETMKIDDQIIKLFIQLIQEEKANIPLKYYKGIYTLSEYFCIPKITFILDNINKKEFLKDLNFTIQILLDSETATNSLETKIASQIENFLIEKINECIENSKFSKLQNSTICRIFDKSKDNINHDLLLDFIIRSADTRFILFKYIELQKLTDNKVDELINFIDKQKEDSKKMILEYMTFNLSFIKQMKNKYDKLYIEMNQTKQELEMTKQKLEQKNQELEQKSIINVQIKRELEQKSIELEKEKQKLSQELEHSKVINVQIKSEYEQVKQNFELEKVIRQQKEKDLEEINEEFEQIKQEKEQKNKEFEQAKIIHVQTEKELEQCRKELMFVKDKLNQVKNDIIVGGSDNYNQLGKESNTKNKYDEPIIAPPVKLSFNPFSHLSYSVYSWHSVIVTSDHSLKGIGNNKLCVITTSLQKASLNQFTEFSIKDKNGNKLDPVSAVCCLHSTLYMFSKINGIGRQLVLCDEKINEGNPIFLDIENQQPVALFGGRSHSAAICSEGEIIFINRYFIKKFHDSNIEVVFLPDGEKASSVACCDTSVLVLSSSGRVFESPIEKRNNVLKFSEVVELKGKEIICVSGVFNHFLAVNKEGRVFGRGSNDLGELGLGKGIKSSPSFIEISSLCGYKIRAAYAGFNHSLFETCEGKILSCGSNRYGQLLHGSGLAEKVYLPTETTVTNGSIFCIAGNRLSVVFIGNEMPSNMPNMKVIYYQK